MANRLRGESFERGFLGDGIDVDEEVDKEMSSSEWTSKELRHELFETSKEFSTVVIWSRHRTDRRAMESWEVFAAFLTNGRDFRARIGDDRTESNGRERPDRNFFFAVLDDDVMKPFDS